MEAPPLFGFLVFSAPGVLWAHGGCERSGKVKNHPVRGGVLDDPRVAISDHLYFKRSLRCR